MTDDEFLLQLREAFTIEAAEHIQAMTHGLLEIEKAPAPPRRAELVETIFRDAHSLKGAARAVNRSDIESLCQALEGVFAQWKKSAALPSAELFDVLNRSVDLIGHLLALTDAQAGSAAQAEISMLVQRLGAASSRPPARSAPPRPAEPLAAEPSGEPSPAAETVRLPMARMDALLRRAEEMIAVKLSAGRNAAELRHFSSLFEAWRKEWAKVRDVARSGPGSDSAAARARLGDFLDWNQSFMQSMERRLAALAGSAVREERDTGIRIDDLLADTKRLLMLPVGTLLDFFPKLVRDLSRAQDKDVALSILGREVEIDKRILQEMKDPLIHLVRNAIDHGLEPTTQRTSAQKSPTGTLLLAVSQLEGSKVQILVRDDGRGIDARALRTSAMQSGTLSAEQAAALDESAAQSLIFTSGITTSPIITEISGRGLGMTIVREKVEKLGGEISIETVPGHGTTFRIVLPVTLATFKGVVVRAGGQSFIIPTAKVERILRVSGETIRTVENRETVEIGGQAVALARLDELLSLPAVASSNGHTEVVVIGTADRRLGLAVEAVLHEREVLVKNIGRPLVRVRNVAGAAILESGSPTIILNTTDLIRTAIQQAATNRQRPIARAGADEKKPPRILVTDDSVTSRMLLKNILESAGYQITTAIDGIDALTALQSSDFDLLVSDVEMPRMDGFDLTARVRADAKFSRLPVILVTALSSREHQERGVDVGASAYIVKSNFDQSNLLEVIRRLL